MGILLGLLTALTWGGADFIARFATHRIGALRSMLYMQLIGLLLLTISLPALGGWGHPRDGAARQSWAGGSVAGGSNPLAGLGSSRGLEIGKRREGAPPRAGSPA